MFKRILLFTLLNFGVLAIGGLFTPSGISSDWYSELNRAPWTPPGWMFGFAWSTIMVCLTIYMSTALKEKNKPLIYLYLFQLILNVSWTPVFFYYHQPLISLVIIVLLTLVIGLKIFICRENKNCKTLLLLPYLIWLCIATSLNWYIVLNNNI
jgi:benzodiazapine receptor